ncbi:class I SAM-dependent methyltransferase [Streptomonospora sediminis]
MAESFGTDAARYDRARPRYPAAMVERIAAAGPGVCDAGCGTGIAARQFQRAGCRVLGVEPDARMAGLARRRGTEVELAAFEDWDPAGRRFDAITAAQSWHWVDPDRGAAKAAAALRPGGRLAVFWNADGPPPELTRAAAEVYQRVIPESPLAAYTASTSATADTEPYSEIIARAASGLGHSGSFGAPERWRFSWERYYTRDEWLDAIPTTGYLTRLEPDRLEKVLAGLGAAIDRLGGGFTMNYTTVVLTAVRTGGGDRAQPGAETGAA